MTDSAFSELAELALKTSGMAIGRSSRMQVESRLTPLLRREGFANIDDLMTCIQNRDHQALGAETVARLASKETWFFRDREQLEHLVHNTLPTRIAPASETNLRIWVAGAASGQEAYSLAILLSEDPELAGLPVDLLATDLDSDCVTRMRGGVYTHFEIQRGLSVHRMLQHFRPSGDGGWQANKPLRDRITARQHNLLSPMDGLGEFDVILCRNVLGGLAAHVRAHVFERLIARLRPGGTIVLGTQENFPEIHDHLAPAGDVAGLFMTRQDSAAIASA